LPAVAIRVRTVQAGAYLGGNSMSDSVTPPPAPPAPTPESTWTPEQKKAAGNATGWRRWLFIGIGAILAIRMLLFLVPHNTLACDNADVRSGVSGLLNQSMVKAGANAKVKTLGASTTLSAGKDTATCKMPLVMSEGTKVLVNYRLDKANGETRYTIINAQQQP
jgi:hypothetical protein